MPEETFFALVKSVGVPAAFSLGLLYSIWKAAGWIATNLIGPIVARQLRFFDDMDRAFDKQTGAIDAMAKTVDALRTTLHAHETLLQRVLDATDDHRHGRRDA